jgi:hypothetical protein
VPQPEQAQQELPPAPPAPRTETAKKSEPAKKTNTAKSETAKTDTAKSDSAKSDSIPTKRTQWVCNATGWWQKCETSSYACYSQSSMAMGFGSTEATARVSAETECNTAMMRLMSVNFTYRTSVTSRCKAVSCSPPNAK